MKFQLSIVFNSLKDVVRELRNKDAAIRKIKADNKAVFKEKVR